MDRAVTSVLSEYHERIERELPLQRRLVGTPDYEKRRDEFLLCIGPQTGQLLNLLVKSARAQVVVEVGASYGYSTVWLAEAARATGGRVYSLEIDPAKVEYGRRMLHKAGLASWVEHLVGDAIATLSTFSRGMDFVLIDLWKPLYVATLEAVYPRLNPGALIAADNILLPELFRVYSAQYQAAVKANPGLETLTIPIGDGVELTRLSG
jgi:predicted O-methyltransferase YrrM